MNHLGVKSHVCLVTERVKVQVEAGDIAKTLYIEQKFDVFFKKKTSKIQDYIIVLLPKCDQREWISPRSTKLVSKGVEIRMYDSWSLVLLYLEKYYKTLWFIIFIQRNYIILEMSTCDQVKDQEVTNSCVKVKPKVTASITIHHSHYSACPLKH